jgi:hypothetical protein
MILRGNICTIQNKQQLYANEQLKFKCYRIDDAKRPNHNYDNVNNIMISSIFENFEVCYFFFSYVAYIFPRSYIIMQLRFSQFSMNNTLHESLQLAGSRWESMGVAWSGFKSIHAKSIGVFGVYNRLFWGFI